MSQKIVKVGAAPGNQGDGDTLRDAFLKTNANFDDLFSIRYVTNTTLQHDDPSIEGTIAHALADASAAGGGMVQLGPGTFSCRTTTLEVPENVTLKGVGVSATTIDVTHSLDGIAIGSQFGHIESLRLNMPENSSGHGVVITAQYATLQDFRISGVGPLSWGIVVDAANVCTLHNIKLGTSFGGSDAFTGNGILFQNSVPDLKPYNYGDSLISKVDIKLGSYNTTGMKFNGPDWSDQVINNILVSKVQVTGRGRGSRTIGAHLRNAKRIVLHTVDFEQLGTAVFEESTEGNAKGSANNVFMGVFAFGGGTGYLSPGFVPGRIFLGCENLNPHPAVDTDVIIPRALWIDDTNARIYTLPDKSNITFDDGDRRTGVGVFFNTDNPSIKPTSSSSKAQLNLGADDTRGVECIPGLILPLRNKPISNAKDGTIAQYAAGVVGPQRGLYQSRGSNWIFIG